MPSQTHEDLLVLFRDQPGIAAEALRQALHEELPEFTEVRIDSAELNHARPAEYRADLVVVLWQGCKPALGIVVEVQRDSKGQKKWVWPVYVTSLRKRLKCPVCLLVVTATERVQRWAAQPIGLGGQSVLVPLVLGPAITPEITDLAEARKKPYQAVLSALFHGQDQDSAKAAQIALAALAGIATLDPEQQKIYSDLVQAALSQEGHEVLETMHAYKYEYKTDFAKHYVAEGVAQGETRGRAALILKLMRARFGPLPKSVEQHINEASIKELEAIGKRLLDAKTLQEALRSRR